MANGEAAGGAADVWRDIAARAATLEERRRSVVLVGPADEGGDVVADARLARWRETAARGEAGRFAAVLAAHGLADEAAARRLLAGPVRLPPGAPLPAWARTAQRIAARSGRAPAVRHARECLRRRVGPEVYAGLSRRAHATLEARLAHRLMEAAAGAREVERQVRRALAASPDRTPGSATPLTDLFRHYSVLARIFAKLVSDWVNAQAEFLRRLRRDRPRLAAAFFPGVADPGPVLTLEAGVGDEHRGGRAVLLLRFAGGRRLVYKPRDLGPERVWRDLVGRWNTAVDGRSALQLRAADVLPRGRGTGAYGWMEWVPAFPRLGRVQRALYARRAGALLALFHVLGGTDGHAENLVATGAHPVLVDAETLAHPPPPVFPGWPAQTAGFTRSLLRTLLVPVPAAFLPPAGTTGEADPWAIPWVPPAGFERRRPRDDGNDEGAVAPTRPPRLDVPRRELLAGFRAASRVLLVTPAGTRWRAHAHRALAGHRVRRVWLPTTFYAELRRRSLTARALRDGADRDIELGWLHRVGGTARTPTDVGTETLALGRLDIPYFVVPARLPDDAPWLAADHASLSGHLGEQADLLARVLSASG